MNIGKELKKARKSANLTQKQVAEKTGIKNTTISNWENGISRPDVDTVAILCKLYNVNPNTIYGWPEGTDDEPVMYEYEKEIWTVQELTEIQDFKDYIKSKRSK